MSIVILGGLLTATFLNMIVIPVLFEKRGRKMEEQLNGNQVAAVNVSPAAAG
jgi:Cu/Ag efflux pump CusA